MTKQYLCIALLLCIFQQVNAEVKAEDEYVDFYFNGYVYGNQTTTPCPEALNMTGKVFMKRDEWYWSNILNDWVFSKTFDLQPVTKVVKQNISTGYYTTKITIHQYTEIVVLDPDDGHGGIYKWKYYASGAQTVLPTQLGWYSINGANQNKITNLSWYMERTNGIHWRYESLLAQKFNPCLVLPGINPVNSNTNDKGVAPKPVEIMLGRNKSLEGRYRYQSLWVQVNQEISGRRIGTYLVGDNLSWLPLEKLGIDPNTGDYSNIPGTVLAKADPPGSDYDSTWAWYFPFFDWAGPDDGSGTYDQPSGWYSAYESGNWWSRAGSNFPNTTYAHLFLADNKPVIQYWFFYPFNNFVNDHEGDWEHINVVLSSNNPETAEIEKVIYYFHERYLVRDKPQSKYPTNFNFYVIDNTHPVVFVGGYGYQECAGISGEGPGSHGSYPTIGYWSSVANPEVSGTIHETIYLQTDLNRQLHYNNFDIVVLKNKNDYDYQNNPEMSWVKADIYWGHYKVTSFGSDWARVGNIAPCGPAHNPVWNYMEGDPDGAFDPYVYNVPYEPANLSGWIMPTDWKIENINFETAQWYVLENQLAYSQDVSSQSAVRISTYGTVVPRGGAWMYKVTGNDIGTTNNGFCYWNLTSIPIVVANNTYLSFWRYVKESPGDHGRIFIDGVTSDGKTFRDWNINSYLCDKNGTRLHPANSRPQTATDGWRQYIVNLSPMAGNVVNLMIGYDDAGAETGPFTAYFDDIEIRQGYPYSNQWYAEEFGDNNGSTVALAGKSGDGVELSYNVWYTYAGELSEWKNGPFLRKNIEPDLAIPDDKDIFVNWTQYDYNHSLHYMLLIKGIDNVDRWLIYSANAYNHWYRQGWVDMSANQTGIYCQDVAYNRNASLDYCTEFGVRAASLKETRVGHFSSTKWSGPSGGYVKDITFTQGNLALPSSPSLSATCYSVSTAKGIPSPDDRTYYAALSWSSNAGSYPLSSYQIQSHYSNIATWVDRATVYTGFWRDSDWALGTNDPIEYRVRSVDSKGNVGPWSNIVKISKPITNDPIIASSTTDEATAFSNGKKIMVDNAGKLHVVFASNDSVFYCTSTDDGNTWSSASSIGQGKNPAIELSGSQKPMVCWSKGNELYRAEKDSLKFTEPQMIYTGPEGTEISYLAYVLDQATDNSYLGWVDDGPSGSAVYISPYNPNTSANLSPTPIDQGGTTAFKSPSLALDKKGKLKTAWSKNGIVYYNDENGLMQISDNGIHPIVETYGDKTTVVWQEEILPNIYQVVKKVKGPKGWAEKQLVSYPDSLNADFPVVAASGQYVYCKNMFDQYYDVIWRGDYDNGWQISVQDITAFSGGISKYPTAVFKQKWPQSKLYIVWTEDMSNNAKGSKATSPVSNVKNYTLSVDPVSYYYADAGTEESDIYTYQKSGSFYYGPQPEYTVDYHATELKYNFQNLDPQKRYRIKVVYYHELDKYVRQTLSVDNTFKKKTTIDPMSVCTEEHWIPTSCIMDGQVDVTITKANGQYAVCSVIALYEYDKDCTDKSGDDYSESTSAVVTQFRYELMQNYPNPNTGKTAIKYQLAKPGKVSLKIYNTLGQVVKTLVSQEQQPGYYNAAWDGKDNGGRQTSAGVYFYRLESGDFKATKKMVVIR